MIGLELNTAGCGLPSAVYADRGQARLHVAPNPSLLNSGRVGAYRAARPVFLGFGRRTAKHFAAQQVNSSLLVLPLLGCRQKSVGFCFGIGVFFPFENLNNAGRVGSQFLRNEGDRYALKTHYMRSNCFDEIERWAQFCGDVQFDPSNWVSFSLGFSSKQVDHGCSFLNMVGRIAMGLSGILPAILWCRTLLKGVASLAGVVTANRHPSAPNTADLRGRTQGLFFALRMLTVSIGNFFHFLKASNQFKINNKVKISTQLPRVTKIFSLDAGLCQSLEFLFINKLVLLFPIGHERCVNG